MSATSNTSNNTQNSTQIKREDSSMDKVDHKETPSCKINRLNVYAISTKRKEIDISNGDNEDQERSGCDWKTVGNQSNRYKTGHEETQKVDKISPSECSEIIDPSLINLNFPNRVSC
jgi:hypothetical protein